MTTQAVRERRKTVTRRIGWRTLKCGDVLNACVKCMGLKKGETPERICQIRVTEVQREPLNFLLQPQNIYWARREMNEEGFMEMEPAAFVQMFCRSHKGCTPRSVVTRIKFEYL